jgi:hypothetical protein
MLNEIYTLSIRNNIMAHEYVKNNSKELLDYLIDVTLGDQTEWQQRINNDDEEKYLALCEKDGLALQFIENQTYDICMAAVKQFTFSIEYVKMVDKYYEICLYAVDQDWKTINLIDYYRLTRDQIKEICRIVLSKDDVVIDYIEREFATCILLLSTRY